MPATRRLPATRITVPLCVAWFLAATSWSSTALGQDSMTDSPLRLEPKAVPGFTAIQRGKGLSFHKANYVQPATWSPEYQGSESEVAFQISLKQRFLINNVYFAYTQKSMWQAINRGNSAPFRETNYNPEIFLRLLPGDDLLHRWHLDRWGFDLGFEHESNGRALPESRSQNRVYLSAFRPDGDTLWHFRTWYRLPEDPKSGPLDPQGDDNPLTDDYYGYGEIAHRHHFGRNRMLMARVHGNLNTGKGAIEIQLSKPSSDGDVFYLFSVFNGYGETLADYDNSVTRIGFGLMFNR
ncbi:MAG: phospholipase A [Gammaproteobacteria bacterium]